MTASQLQERDAVVLNIALSLICITAFSAVLVLCRRQRRLEDARRSDEASFRARLATAERRATQATGEQGRVTRFLKEFPHVAHQMYAGANVRKIPGLLLTCLVRFFEPRKALVAIRRRPSIHDPDRRSLFVVAASHPDATCVPPGTTFRLGEGELGFVAEGQRVLGRDDLRTLPAATRLALEDGALKGIKPDLVAPLVFEEETVGVVAVEGGHRWPVDPRDVIRMIAQVGALAVHSLERFTEMKSTASLDGLTQIYNKRFLDQQLDEAIREAPSGGQVAVFLFDVDNFKHYNDRNGHVAGDILLRQLARLVQENVRKETTFGRFGGEEFLLILPGATKEEALQAAENLRTLIADFRFAEAAAQPLGCVSISGGVSECPIDATDRQGLLKCADEALYAAKGSGRNRVLPYTPAYLGAEEAVEPTGVPLLLPGVPSTDDEEDPSADPADTLVTDGPPCRDA